MHKKKKGVFIEANSKSLKKNNGYCKVHKVEIIGSDAFYKNKEVKTVDIANYVKTIQNYAFAESSIEEITIPDSVIDVGYNTFEGCKNLKKVIWSKNAKEIKNSTFEDCISLQQVTIPEGVEEILPLAFARCLNLRSVVLPSTINKIGSSAFTNCYELESIYIPENVKLDPSIFGNCPEYLRIYRTDKQGKVTRVERKDIDKIVPISDSETEKSTQPTSEKSSNNITIKIAKATKVENGKK